MPDATSLRHYLENKQLKLYAFSGRIQQKEYFILYTLMRGVANTCIWLTAHAAGKLLHLLYRKEMEKTLQPHFCKAGYRPVSVQYLNSTQDSIILTMVLEAVI